MTKRNPHLAKLAGSFIFSEVAKHRNALQKSDPRLDIISLGVGDTPGPLTPYITKALTQASAALGTPSGFSGYGPYEGIEALRKKIADVLYPHLISGDEVFISDGAKCAVGRLQVLFGPHTKIAVQDPVYPVYVDTSVTLGQTGEHNSENEHYDGLIYLKCSPENGFFPQLPEDNPPDVIYFCSPNNPTGTCATRAQLETLVSYAKRHSCIIVFDSAYSAYIQDPDLPKSIYEIEGARQVAIEVGSLSKMANFTGVRLGWTVIPRELHFEDGTPVRDDWARLLSTFFNGTSNIIQQGALAVLDDEGLAEVKTITTTFLDNAALINRALKNKGITTYGGEHCPFVWAHFPGQGSWQTFKKILEQAHVVTTPGIGFGPSGEDFIRFSAFNHRDTVEKAVNRLINVL